MDYEINKIKVLIINGISIGAQNATGLTLRNIFSTMNDIEILQFCIDKSIENNAQVVNTLSISNNNIPLESFFRNIANKKSKLKNNNKMPSIATAAVAQSGFKNKIHDFIRGILDSSLFIYDKNILEHLDEFKPDIIYTLGGTIRILKIANKLSDRYKAPIVLHLMDNWPDTIYTSSWISFCSRLKLLKELRRLHNKSKRCLAISEKMANEYQTRYKVQYNHVMNCVKHVVSKEYENKTSSVKFIYAGGLHLNRWKSLKELASIIVKLRTEGVDVELTIYTALKDINQFGFEFHGEGIKINPYVPHSMINDIYESADVLVHIESFELNVVDYTKFSMSTKIPEYMAAGRAILCYAPKTLASSEYIKDHEIGLVATTKEELKYCINSIVKDKSIINKFGKNGRSIALKDHTQDIVIKKVYNAFKESLND